MFGRKSLVAGRWLVVRVIKKQNAIRLRPMDYAETLRESKMTSAFGKLSTFAKASAFAEATADRMVDKTVDKYQNAKIINCKSGGFAGDKKVFENFLAGFEAVAVE